MWLVHIINIGMLNEYFYVDRPAYIDMFWVGYHFRWTFVVVGFKLLILLVRAFGFLSLSRELSKLPQTLSRGCCDILNFLIASMVLILGFMLLGHHIFGQNVYGFHSLTFTFAEIFKSIFGVFDYETWERAFPSMATIWLLLVQASMLVVVVNCIIAILMQAFEAVTRDNNEVKGWYFGIRPYPFEVYLQIYMCCSRRRCLTSLMYGCCPCCTVRRRDTSCDGHGGHGSGGRAESKDSIDDNYTSSGGSGGSQRTSSRRGGRDGRRGSLCGCCPVVDEEAREAEENFIRQMARAYHSAKRLSPPVNLFKKFEQAYFDARRRSKGHNMYVSKDMLCRWVTPKKKRLDCYPAHAFTCQAWATIDAYGQWKKTHLLGRKSYGPAQTLDALLHDDALEKFSVVKINEWGRRHYRLIAVDVEAGLLKNFGLLSRNANQSAARLRGSISPIGVDDSENQPINFSAYSLGELDKKREMRIEHILQAERSCIEPRLLTIVFSEKAHHAHWHLVFQDVDTRDQFTEILVRTYDEMKFNAEHGGGGGMMRHGGGMMAPPLPPNYPPHLPTPGGHAHAYSGSVVGGSSIGGGGPGGGGGGGGGEAGGAGTGAGAGGAGGDATSTLGGSSFRSVQPWTSASQRALGEGIDEEEEGMLVARVESMLKVNCEGVGGKVWCSVA